MISQEAYGKGSWFDSDKQLTDKASDGSGEIIVESDEEGNTVVNVPSDYVFDESFFSGSDSWEIPNLLYCPENIFGNNIAMLDVNFLNENTYKPVVEGGDGDRGVATAKEKSESIAGKLKNTISSWYKAFRNIAIVALLSILVYLGIRMLISSAAEDKAKYKESIKNWLVALCLVFFMHFIMSATIMMVNQINDIFNHVSKNIYVVCGNMTFKSNFTGVIRFLAQSTVETDAWAYTVMYAVLVGYTISFTFQYLKRVLYIAFYTMISPLVAITYPIDKLGDGKAQAFNMWFKEYIMTMVLQPIHLIIYTMIVSSALTLSIQNPLYALVAIGFLIPAEQFIKKLFGVQSTADGGFGTFASGAATMAGIQQLSKLGKGGSNEKKGKAGQSSESGENDSDFKIRQSSNSAFDNFKGVNSNEGTLNYEGQSYIGEGNSVTSGAGNGGLGAQFNMNAGAGNGENETQFNMNTGEGGTSNGRRSSQARTAQQNTQTPQASNLNGTGNNKKPSLKQRAIKNASAVKDATKKFVGRRYTRLKRNARDGVKNAVLNTPKRLGQAALGTLGATVGLAAGIASGKGLSEAAKYAATGLGAGAAIGNRLPGANSIEKGLNEFEGDFLNEKYGEERCR